LSNFDETYREYLPAPTDNLIRFWRSKVKIAEVYGKNIHVNTGGIEVQLLVLTRVSPVTERPTWRRVSVHAKYPVLHHGNETIFPTWPSC